MPIGNPKVPAVGSLSLAVDMDEEPGRACEVPHHPYLRSVLSSSWALIHAAYSNCQHLKVALAYVVVRSEVAVEFVAGRDRAAIKRLELGLSEKDEGGIDVRRFRRDPGLQSFLVRSHHR